MGAGAGTRKRAATAQRAARIPEKTYEGRALSSLRGVDLEDESGERHSLSRIIRGSGFLNKDVEFTVVCEHDELPGLCEGVSTIGLLTEGDPEPLIGETPLSACFTDCWDARVLIRLSLPKPAAVRIDDLQPLTF